jgi:GAF domain-containing protein/pyridoxamine 5'-phosphate oxidase-like protein
VSTTLESLATCFQGLLPAQLFTCSADGIPNAAYLSHVEYVDSSHVALSYQFFNKSKRNITENPQALVLVPDPDTGQGWRLRLRFERSETEGPLFERMALRIEAIASYCGLKGIFKLRAADVYRVLDIAAETEERGRVPAAEPRAAGPDPVFTLLALQDLTERIHKADSLETLVDSILSGLEASYGFRQSMILVPAEEPGVLVTIATRGYPEQGAGAEVRIGEGIAGVVAEARKPIRISGLMRGMLYALAMHRQATGERLRPKIALPGLASPESQLGVPLLVRGELVGVLCLESETPYRFHEEDKKSIELLGSYLAIAIQNMQLQERVQDTAADGPPPEPAAKPVAAPASAGATRREVAFYTADETILVDGEYLIRSLPAKILWRLLTIREKTGRAEFTNRELRLDKSLQLPEWKDNLESRLLLLRRRLEQKCPELRLVPVCRGRFALELSCPVALVTRP